MLSLLAQPRVKSCVSDQCEYGLTTWNAAGEYVPAKKPTRWATTSDQMLHRLSQRCTGKHKHEHLLGGKAASAAFYPLPLITSILRGMRDTADHEHAECDGPTREVREAMSRVANLHDQPHPSLQPFRGRPVDNPTAT